MRYKLAILFICPLIFAGCKQRGYNWAQTEFNRDKNEHLMLIRYGEPPDDKEEYFWTILENDYNITRKFSTGCVIDKGIKQYNDLMEAEIKKKFGNDFFGKIDLKVDSIYTIDKPLIELVKNRYFTNRTKSIFRYSVFNTNNDSIKIVCGYGWCMINKRLHIANLFRVPVNRYTNELKSIDSTRIEVSPLGYR